MIIPLIKPSHHNNREYNYIGDSDKIIHLILDTLGTSNKLPEPLT